MKDRFKNWERPNFDKEGFTKYGWRCQYHENLELGERTDVGCFAYLQAQNGIVIEDDVQIGGGAMIYSSDTIDNLKGKVVLRKNCKIGANSVVLPNVVVNENSVVGACSLLRYGTEVPKDEIWSGVPAKKIGYIKNGKRIYQK